MLRAVTRFCDARREELERTTVGLFLCCLYTGEAAREELSGAFPAWLHAHAKAEEVFGGAVRVEGLSSIDRYLVRRVARVDADISAIDAAAIERLAKAINAEG